MGSKLLSHRALAVQAARIGRRVAQLPSDQEGSISLLSVFALLILTMLLGMVMNVGRQVDRKVRMQHTADACTYSGGLVLARGMNSLAFTNHLLCDVFALTAFMREARDRDSESQTPPILQAWEKIGPAFARSSFPKFAALGPAIQKKVPLERELVRTYGEWASASSEMILPVLEEILAQELITRFQRSVVQITPHLAQMTMLEIAERHGRAEPNVSRPQALLWRTSADPVGAAGDGPDAWEWRTLPVVDPVGDPVGGQRNYKAIAIAQRSDLAHQYLNDWNDATLRPFDQKGKMSQFSNLWRGFTCGKLEKLLNEEYPDRNLPFVIRTPVTNGTDVQKLLDEEFMFLGVAYQRYLPQTLPGLFKNPIQSDSQTYAQVMMFVPRQRLSKFYSRPSNGGGGISGGLPGEINVYPADDDPVRPNNAANVPAQGLSWVVGRLSRPTHWDLLNQNWTVQIVPATSPSLGQILQTNPPGLAGMRVPSLRNLAPDDLQQLNTH